MEFKRMFNIVLLLMIIFFFLFLMIFEFKGYQKFYSGEHNIDNGYNMKGTSFKEDLLNNGTIVSGTQLYILGTNQKRESLLILLQSQMITLLLGSLIGILIGINLKGEKLKWEK